MNKHDTSQKSAQFPLLLIQSTSDAGAFIGGWKQLYNYPGWDQFESLVRQPKLTKAQLLELFHWKNNMVLSASKSESFERNIAVEIDLVNKLKLHFDPQQFDAAFGKMRAVWQTFLLHIVNPELPIFDQHVYRAFYFLTEGTPSELPKYQPACMSIYHEQYVPFFRHLIQSSPKYSSYDIDHALWAFGKFLKDYPNAIFGKT